jgi:tetratricopeptide (TPR) repeat protein
MAARRWRQGLGVLVALGGAAAAAPTAAQPGAAAAPAAPVALSAAELVARGDREYLARRPAAALALYEQAIARDPRGYAALWRAARDAIDVGEFTADADQRRALYRRAEGWARTAVREAPRQVEGHFELARALGRTALALGPRERVKYATEVKAEADAALAIDPSHAGAHHVVGVWHAEIMRLSGITRAFARTFLGAAVFSSASWAAASAALERAVALEPARLVHKLDLARVYRDMGRVEDARRSYRAALMDPLSDANDERYKAAAQAELDLLR